MYFGVMASDGGGVTMKDFGNTSPIGGHAAEQINIIPIRKWSEELGRPLSCNSNETALDFGCINCVYPRSSAN